MVDESVAIDVSTRLRSVEGLADHNNAAVILGLQKEFGDYVRIASARTHRYETIIEKLVGSLEAARADINRLEERLNYPSIDKDKSDPRTSI